MRIFLKKESILLGIVWNRLISQINRIRIASSFIADLLHKVMVCCILKKENYRRY